MLLTMEKEDHMISREKVKKNGNKKKKDCLVQLLTGQEFRCQVQKQANGLELLEEIFNLLNIKESDYFGLYFKDITDNKYWLEPNKSIKKQVKNGPWSFYFAVKFYPPDPAQLLEDITRYYMVLQIRDDIVGGRLPCSFVTHALLGSYVVQSELGDYDRGDMRGNYVSEFVFAPNQTKELEDRIMELHKTHRGQTPEQAEKNYLENAKKLSLYGVDIHHAKDSDGISLLVGISWNGVLIYRDGALINRFAWPRVIKLSYARSKFFVTIRPLDGDERLRMIGFKMSNYRTAKNAWKSGVEHHGFFRLVRTDQGRRPSLVRVGSKFRYSGRTQQETRSAVAKDNERVAPKVVRADSRRLRSGRSGIPPKTKLGPVKEESSEEVPPLPEKTRKKTKEDVTNGGQTVTETIVTTVSTEVVEEIETKAVHTMPTETNSEQGSVVEEKDNLSLSSDEQEYPDISNPLMTEHQKQVHMMKPSNEELTDEVHFLKSESPRPAGSRDSLDLIDERLSSCKLAKVDQELALPDKELTVGSTSSTTSTKENLIPLAVPNDSELAINTYNVERRTQADDTSSDSSYVQEDKGVDTQYGLRSSSNSESDPIPTVTSPENRSSLSSADQFQDEDVVPLNGHQSSNEDIESHYVVSHPDEDAFCENIEVNHNLPEDSIQIATVETRTVRVEEVLIPQDKNEIHHVSLSTDKDDRLVVCPAVEDEERSSVSSMSSSSSSSHHSVEQNYYQPPTIKTAPLLMESYVEDVPKGTTNPPMVHTELKTITYESTKPASFETSQPQLVSSQIITSETEHTITTTEITKIAHGEINETRVEKQMVTIGDSTVDHSKEMAEMILDTQRNNPNIDITKIVVHEHRSVLESE